MALAVEGGMLWQGVSVRGRLAAAPSSACRRTCRRVGCCVGHFVGAHAAKPPAQSLEIRVVRLLQGRVRKATAGIACLRSAWRRVEGRVGAADHQAISVERGGLRGLKKVTVVASGARIVDKLYGEAGT